MGMINFNSIFFFILSIVCSFNFTIWYFRSVNVEDLSKAITTIDPDIEVSDLDKYLCWAFNCSKKEDLETAKPSPKAALKIRLLNSGMKRIGSKIVIEPEIDMPVMGEEKEWSELW